jgi:hypothetical protein
MRDIARSRSKEIATETVVDAPVPKDWCKDHKDRRRCKPLASKNLLHCTLAAVSNPL